MHPAWFLLQQRNLDAAFGLLAARNRYLRALDSRGRPRFPGVEVVGIGLSQVRRSLSAKWAQELLAIGVARSAEMLDYSYTADRRLLDSGMRLVSLYDWGSTQADSRAELHRRREWGTSFYCASHVQLKIYDRRCVLLEGPQVHGQRSVLAISDRAVVTEALRYFRAVQRSAVPVARAVPELVPEFTERQHRLIRLLPLGRTDAELAEILGVSVRTVHYELARILHALGARSRFAAAVRLTELGLLASGGEQSETAPRHGNGVTLP